MGLTRILRTKRYFRWYYRLPLTSHLISGKTREWTLLMGLIDMAISVTKVVEYMTRPKWSSDRLVTVGQVYKWVWEVGSEYDESIDQRRTDKTNTGVSPSTPSTRRSPSGIHILCLPLPNQTFDPLSKLLLSPFIFPLKGWFALPKVVEKGYYSGLDFEWDMIYMKDTAIKTIMMIKIMMVDLACPVSITRLILLRGPWTDPACQLLHTHGERSTDCLKLVLILLISFISSTVLRTYSLLTTP